jgi:hypothetical protein
MPINNPSYASNPAMWHSVALQQQRLAEMKLNLGPPRPLRPSALRRPQAQPPPPQQQQQQPADLRCSDCSESDSDDLDDDGSSGNPRRQRRRKPTLTLAQRMGLAEAPEPELTPSEWDAITATSRAREASREPCVICQEPFMTSKQVLLSCGHTFHRTCLRSWERHSKSRCCPVCRKLHYRKRTIDDGANLYREECVVRLQAAARGALARRATAKALRHLNPTRRRRYCEQRLGGLADRLIRGLDAEHSAVDDLFAEIDSSVAASRALLGGADGDDWVALEALSRARGLGDCPVCLNACTEAEPLALLSCTHVFHSRCLDSFETFSLQTTCKCPVCRAPHYRRRALGAPAGPAAASASAAAQSPKSPRPPPPAPPPAPPQAPVLPVVPRRAGGGSAGGGSAGGGSQRTCCRNSAGAGTSAATATAASASATGAVLGGAVLGVAGASEGATGGAAPRRVGRRAAHETGAREERVPSAAATALEHLSAMGFSRGQGRLALQQTSNDVEAAITLLVDPAFQAQADAQHGATAAPPRVRAQHDAPSAARVAALQIASRGDAPAITIGSAITIGGASARASASASGDASSSASGTGRANPPIYVIPGTTRISRPR